MRAHQGEVLGWLSFVSVLIVAAGLIWHQDTWPPIAAAIVVGIAWCFVVAPCMAAALDDGDTVSAVFISWSIRSAQILTLLAPISILCAGSSSSGIYVNAHTGATTLTNGIIFALPFRDSVFYVPNNYSVGREVRFTTRDGIPLRCDIKADGIALDLRDVRSLKAFLVDEARAGNPAGYIGATLEAALAQAAVSVLSQRTSDEIERQRRFVIPYSIGSPLANSFGRLHVLWREGAVSTSCAVAFSN